MPLVMDKEQYEKVSEELQNQAIKIEDDDGISYVVSEFDLADYEHGLKSALDKERKGGKELAADKKSTQAKHDAEIAKLIKERDTAIDGDKDQRAVLQVEYQEKIDAKDAEHASTTASMQKQLDDVTVREQSAFFAAEVATACASHSGNTPILAPVIREQTKVVLEDGELIVRPVNKKGEPRIMPGGELMTLGDLVKSMRADETFGKCFKGTGNSGNNSLPGGGDRPHVGRGKSLKDIRRSELTTQQKVALINEIGNEDFQNLPL